MKTYISLNKNVDCQYLCGRIFAILNDCISKNIDLSNKILYVELKESFDEIQPIYNLEYKE